MPNRRKSTAREWVGSKTPNTKFRDRGTAHLPDGSSKRVDGYGPTKAAASADLDAKTTALENVVPQADTITVAALFAEFLEHKRSVKGNKAKTIYDDLDMFKRHVQPSVGALPLTALSLTHVQRVQSALTNRGKWRSAERCTILMKALLNFAAKRYRSELQRGTVHLLMRDDVDNIKRPPGAKRKVNPLWTVEQVQAFLALSRAQYEAHPRNILYPLFHTALEAGLRRGELLGMRRGALTSREIKGETRHFLAVTEQIIYYDKGGHEDTPKTPASVRVIPVTTGLAELLRSHTARMDRRQGSQTYRTNDLMFPSYRGTPITPRNVYRARDALIEKLGFTPSTLHEMRKASNTHFTAQLMREGRYSPKIVSKRLGHTNDAVSMQIYTLVNDEEYLSATLNLAGDWGILGVHGGEPDQKKEDAEW